MQSNRLIVTLNKEMQIGFVSGLNQVYENSVLVNEFVVRPSFTLEAGQAMLVTFSNAESDATVTLKPTLLAEREITANSGDGQAVNNDVAQIQQTTSTGYEYYVPLPSEVMQAPGKWYFSIQICQDTDEQATRQATDTLEKYQNKTSDIADFTVYSSLAGVGPNGSTPSDYDIMSLYNTATVSVAKAKESADNAINFAESAQAAAQTAQQSASKAEGSATEAINYATAAEQSATAANDSAIASSNNAAASANSAAAAQKSADDANTAAANARQSAKDAADAETSAKAAANSAEQSASSAQGAAQDAAASSLQAQASAQSASETAAAVENVVAQAEEIIANATDTIAENATAQATAATQQAVVDETNRAMQAELDLSQSISSEIDDIKQLIPSSASSSNPLTDKDFVNSSINNMAAFYITYNAAGDAFPTKASLLNATTFYSGGKVRVPTQNDYATVLSDESQSQGTDSLNPTTRYTYQTDTQNGSYPNGQWDLSFIVNSTPLTQAQLNAVNSGITDALVQKLENIQFGTAKGTYCQGNDPRLDAIATNTTYGRTQLSGDDTTGICGSDAALRYNYITNKAVDLNNFRSEGEFTLYALSGRTNFPADVALSLTPAFYLKVMRLYGNTEVVQILYARGNNTVDTDEFWMRRSPYSTSWGEWKRIDIGAIDTSNITILSQSVTYQASTSGTTVPTGTWGSTIPSVTKGQYLWSKTVVTYSDGTSTTTYNVAYQGKDGANGTNGTNGIITSTAVLLNYIYPVGSIYMSFNNLSPASFLGGTWAAISAGYFLEAAGDGGSLLTKSAGLPNITGSATFDESFHSSGASSSGNNALQGSGYGSATSAGAGGTTLRKSTVTVSFNASNSNSIYGSSNTVQPKSRTVYMWQRTV